MNAEAPIPIESRLLLIAKLFQPALEEMRVDERNAGISLVFKFLYSAPIAVVRLVWLTTVTDPGLIRTPWPTLLILSGLVILLKQLTFTTPIEIAPRSYSAAEGSLREIVSWSAALVFGPAALVVDRAGRTGDAPQFDDIMLLIAARDPAD